MIQVSSPEAEASLSELIQLLETKTEDFIIITRNGKPAVKITLVDESPVSGRIGAAKGKFAVRGDFDAGSKEIAAMLIDGPPEPAS